MNTEISDLETAIEPEAAVAPTDQSDAEIVQKMEELGYLDYGLDI